MKTRILSWLLIFVMCASLLSACDASAGQSSDEPNTPAHSETVSTEGTTDQIVDSEATVDPPDETDSTQSGDEEPDASQNGDQSSETDPPMTQDPEGTSQPPVHAPTTIVDVSGFSLSLVGSYSGKAYVSVNGNTPYFTADELTSTSFELYSDLDSLGRCGTVYASIGKDLMPTEERGSIGMVKPTGWHTVRYDDLVDGKYLYNRCHLIGFQLTGENANTSNLITGTRYLNIEGMLPFENMVADYVKETGNHVMYRVTPVFEGNNLLASGVLMEGYSVEDKGAGICFCVYAHNVQPGIEIDYATGESKLVESSQPEQPPAVVVPAPTPTPEPEEQPSEEPDTGNQSSQANYILNTNTKKFHYPSCSSVDDMKEKNEAEFFGSRDEAVAQGYSPCGRCKP